MMTVAYNELYLDDAMLNLGDMLEYAVYDCGFSADEFFSWFIISKVADKFGSGNPKYIAGMSGVELVGAVLSAINKERPTVPKTLYFDKTPEYWAGWILAYYQWKTGMSFRYIVNNGLTIQKVLSMYILHEADESKFFFEANKIIEKNKEGRESRLKEIRKARGYTQKQLSENSGVALRMVQLYEQKQNDIKKASLETVLSLAKVLGCEIQDLID